MDARGGHLSAADKRIRLDVPPGLFKRAVRLRVSSRLWPNRAESKRPLIEFDLDALDVGTNVRLSQFNRPLTLTVNLSGVIDLAQIPSNMYVALYTVNAEGNQVPVWPLQIDAAAGTISAQIDHFSSWGAGLYPGTPGVWEFNYTAPEVALHSGAATAQIPLKVPAGRNSLQPHLALSYNSATLNGVSGSVLGSADWTRGSALGGFWELDGFAKIAREKWDSCKWGDDSNWRYTSCFKDVFTLILDGTGYNLVPAVEGQTYGRYYAEGGPAVEVYRYNNCAVHNTETGRCTTTNPTGNPSPSNETGEWWLVRLPDGTALELGKTIDAEQVAGNICNPVNDATTMRCKKIDGGTYGMGYRGSYAGASNGNPSKAARAWWVDTVTDTSGNTMKFEYGTFWFNNGERVTPRAIYYNNFPGGYLTRIVLNGTDTHPPNNEPTIDDVALYTKDANGVEQLAHRYWFTRAWFNRNKWDGSQNNRSDVEVLANVQEEGTSGVRLPVQTLTYEWRNTRDAYDIMQLTGVNNGYGGVTTFDYVDDMRPYGGYCTWAGCNDHIVSSRRVATGGGSPDLLTTYEYGQVCHDAYNPGGPTECASRATILCGLACDYDRFVKLSGFGVITTTQWDGATPVSRSKYYFKNANPAWFKGREYKVEQLDPANNNAVLTQQETTWSDKLNGAWFAFAGDQTATTYSGGQAASTRTSYTVDAYNNVSSTYHYGAEVRVPNAGFENNTTDWSYWAQHTPITATTATAFAGRSSLMIQSTGDDYAATAVSGLISGTTYVLRAWVTASPGSTAQAQLYVTDSSGRWINGPTVQPNATHWISTSMSFVANGSATYWLAVWYTHNNNGAVYLDEVALARSSDVGDERSTHSFYHNLDNGRWFIGLKYAENIFSTITPNVANYALLKTQSLWYYDDYTYNPAAYGQTSQINRGLVSMEGRGLVNHAPDPYVTLRYQYDQWGNPIVITDTRGNPTRAEYDGQYHLYTVAITNALTQPTRYAYDKVLGAITSVTDANSATTQYGYDALGRLLKVAKPNDTLSIPTIEYAYVDGYSASGLTGLKVREDYREVSGDVNAYRPIVKFYDGLGRLVQERAETVNGTQQSVTNVTYDARGLTRYAYVPEFESFSWDFTRPGGWDSRAKTSSTYDALGRTVRSIATDGVDQTTVYGVNTTAQVDGNGHYRVNQLDGYGRLAAVDEAPTTLEETFTSLNTSVWTFSCQGATAGCETLEGGAVRTIGTGSNYNANFYRAAYHLNGGTQGQGVKVEFKTDGTDPSAVLALEASSGSAYYRVGLIAGSGKIYGQYRADGTNWVYPADLIAPLETNAWYVLTIKVLPSGLAQVDVWRKDQPGKHGAYQVQLPAGLSYRFHHWTYRNNTWLDNYHELNFQTTRYTYDVLGNLKGVTDALQNTTAINYDVLGRKTNMTDPDMGYWQYQYDDGGNLITQTDANGTVLGFNYDALNRLLDKRQSGQAGTVLASYTYGSVAPNIGYRLRMDDQSGYATWAYDVRGRVLTETKAITINNASNVFTTNLGYDALDRVITTTYPTGEVVTQTYNNLGALENVRSANLAGTPDQWYVKNLDYNAQGALTLAQVGNNVNTTYTYDPLNFRLKTLNVSGLYRLQYGYDNIGNVLSWTSLYTLPTALTESMQYQYDALDRLTRAIAVTNGYTGTYTYDKIGNINSTTQLGTYFYEADSRGLNCAAGTQEIKPHAVSQAGNNTYQYDCNGNMTERVDNNVTYQQQWDVENRLIVVTNTNVMSVTRFVYDGDGARVLQIKPDGSQTAYVSNLLEVEFVPPAAPSNLGAAQASSSQINLTWVDNSNNESGFKIERSPNGSTGWAEIDSVAANITAYSNTNLACNTTYYYRVKAYNSAGYSAYTSVASAMTGTCATPPAAPSNLSATAFSTQINLAWTDNSTNETQFEIERTAGIGWSVIASVGVNVTSYTDWPCGNGLAAAQATANGAGVQVPSVVIKPPPGSTTYSYRVRAYNAGGYSGYSNTASATIYCLFYGDAVTTGAPGTLAMTLNNPPSGQIWKTYYFAGSQAIALRAQGDPVAQNNGVFFLHSDHLGSASLTTNASGVAAARQLYDAWGNIRASASSGTMPTDIGYTGQRADSYIKLVQMGARWYDPEIGRWLSPDSIVPEPGNPVDLNRYSYTRNNPVKYTDPSGHCSQDKDRDAACWELVSKVQQQFSYDVAGLGGLSLKVLQSLLSWMPHLEFTGLPWTGSNLYDVNAALNMVSGALQNKTLAALGLKGNKLTFEKQSTLGRTDPGAIGGHAQGEINTIFMSLTPDHQERAIEVAIHEMGHIADWHAGNNVDFSLSSSEPWLAAGNYFPVTGGWVSADPYLPNRVFPSQYAAGSSDPREDFAETFAWYVYTKNGASYQPAASYNAYGPSGGRQNALSVALDKFK